MKPKTFMHLATWALIAVTVAGNADAQTIKLPIDAEYNGALIDATIPIYLYGSGRLRAGTLKNDYVRDSYIFTAKTNIAFYEDAKVQSGTSKADIAAGPFVFAPGVITFHPNGKVQTGILKSLATDANLSIPANCKVTLSADGKVVSIDGNGSPAYMILGRNVRGSVGVVFDTGAYRMTYGVHVAPQLVARLITKTDVMGSHADIPVVVPSLSQMDVRIGTPSAETYDRWTPPTFVLKGMDFGIEPTLFIRDMRLVLVQIHQSRTINGRTFNAQDYIWLTEAGDIIP
jgi:hypothetical protein